ncbi:MAG: glycosyltransferase family 4 protein [Candidatus Diapherotrites archaeon]
MGRFAYKLAKELSKRNSVSVVCNGDHNASANIRGIDFHFLKSRLKFKNTPLNLGLLPKLNHLIRENDYDLVQAFTPVPFFADMAAIAARKNKIPFFLSYNTFDLRGKGIFLDPLIYLYQKTFERFTLNSAKKIILYNKNLSESDALSMHRNKTEFVHPGIDKEVFYPTSRSADYFLFVGTLNRKQKWKGLSHLLKAIKILKSRGLRARLKVAGTGDSLDHFKTISRKLGIENNVDFLGFLNDRKLAETYNKCHSLVAPSFTNAELMPFVITEAFACGKPVIASSVGGIPYIIDRWHNGLLVNPQKPIEIADMMELILRDSRIPEILGKNALNSVAKYSWSNTAKEIEQIYERSI